MRLLFFSLLLTLLAYGCGIPVVVQQGSLLTFDSRELPYQAVVHKKIAATKLAVLVNDNPDTFKIAQSPLMAMLADKGYKVLLPGKPGESGREKEQLDNKNYRAKDIFELIAANNSLEIKELLLVGIGEGGYLLPELATLANPQRLVVINAGPYSPLAEYEELLRHPHQNAQTLNKIVWYNSLYTSKELSNRIDSLKKQAFGLPQLMGGTNAYWLSYYHQPLMESILTLQAEGLWIVSKDYPLISPDSKTMVNHICSSIPTLTCETMEGRGNFNKEKEMEQLVKVVEAFINNPN